MKGNGLMGVRKGREPSLIHKARLTMALGTMIKLKATVCTLIRMGLATKDIGIKTCSTGLVTRNGQMVPNSLGSTEKVKRMDWASIYGLMDLLTMGNGRIMI